MNGTGWLLLFNPFVCSLLPATICVLPSSFKNVLGAGGVQILKNSGRQTL